MTPDALTEPQRRLLAAIGQAIAGERVRELHLFAPIRQGGVETGLAVVAAGDPPPAAEAACEAPPPPAEMAAIVHAAEAAAEGVTDVDADLADEAPDEVAADLADAPGPPIERAPVAPAAAARFTIYTARYRLQLKGPDRGKWETEIVAEADAPLLTVDAVVRGVQRRAGELTAVERLDGAALQQLLAVVA